MKQRKITRPVARLLLCALLLHFALLLTACGGASGAAAATMHLKKAEGTVGVADGEGNDIALAENLVLYSGYKVATEAESYAWIDLDAVKLAKMDAESAVEIAKDGKQLTVHVQTGSLFFNVTEPLADDESMEIATSSLLVGIRGTCGWVTQNSAALLEGTVTVTAGEQTVTVNAGEMAVLTEEGALEVKPFSAASVPTFVRTEVVEDEQLAAEVLETTGMDLSKSDPVMPRRAETVVSGNLNEVLYTEWVDFAGDGAPELLVIGIKNREANSARGPDRDVWFYIFADDDERSPDNGRDYIDNGVALYSEAIRMEEYNWFLVEADGRQFLEIYHNIDWEDPGREESAQYYGFDAEGNWFLEHIYYMVNGSGSISGSHHIVSGLPYGSDRED